MQQSIGATLRTLLGGAARFAAKKHFTQDLLDVVRKANPEHKHEQCVISAIFYLTYC